MGDDAIALAWSSYLTDVVPDDASDVQVVETQRAFYAGAAACLRIVAAIGDQEEDDDAGAARLEALARELETFGESVDRDG